MTPATILQEAEVELWEAVAYYEEKSLGLGLDFEAEVERSLRTIRDFPERWPGYWQDRIEEATPDDPA